MIQQPAATFGPPRSAPAGWYADPYGSEYARYFDGYRWTPYLAQPGQLGRFSASEPEPHPELPLPVMVGAVLILAASLITSNQLLDRLVDREWNVVVYMSLAVSIGYGPSVAWLWFATKRWGSGHFFADLGVRFRWVDLGWGPLIWLGNVVAMGVALGVIRAFDVPFRGNLDVDNGTAFERDNTLIISWLVAAVVCAPIVEEALFRGAMMRGLLSKMGPTPAIALQAMLFGGAHFNPDFGRDNVGLIIVLSLSGAGFGLGAFLTRRLGPGMIAHAVMNAIAISVALS